MSKTVIDLRDDLIERARELTGLSKKVDLVNYALERLVRQKEIEEILKFEGRIDWYGDLRQMRKDRIDPGR